MTDINKIVALITSNGIPIGEIGSSRTISYDHIRECIKRDFRENPDYELKDYITSLEDTIASFALNSQANQAQYEKEYAGHVNEVKDLKFKLHQEERVNDGILDDADKIQRDLEAKISDLKKDAEASQYGLKSYANHVESLDVKIENLTEDVNTEKFKVNECHNLISTLKSAYSQAKENYNILLDENRAALYERDALKKALLVWVDKFMEKNRGLSALSVKYEANKVHCEKMAEDIHTKAIEIGRLGEHIIDGNNEIRYWMEVSTLAEEKLAEMTKAHTHLAEAHVKLDEGRRSEVATERERTKYHLERANELERDRDTWKGASIHNEFMCVKHSDRAIAAEKKIDALESDRDAWKGRAEKLKADCEVMARRVKKEYWPGSTIEKCEPPSVVIADSAHGLFFTGETLEEAKNHNNVNTSIEERKAIVAKRASQAEMCVDSPFYDMDDVGAPYSEEMKIEKEELDKIEKKFEDPFLISVQMDSTDWDKLTNPQKVETIKEDLEKADARKAATQSAVQWVRDKIEEDKFIRRNSFVDPLPAISLPEIAVEPLASLFFTSATAIPEDVKIQYAMEPAWSLAQAGDFLNSIKIAD